MNKNEICTEVLTVQYASPQGGGVDLARGSVYAVSVATRDNPMQYAYLDGVKQGDLVGLTLHHPDAKLLVAGSDEAMVDALERVRKALEKQPLGSVLTMYQDGSWTMVSRKGNWLFSSCGGNTRECLHSLSSTALHQLTKPEPPPKPKTLREAWAVASSERSLSNRFISYFQPDDRNRATDFLIAYCDKHHKAIAVVIRLWKIQPISEYAEALEIIDAWMEKHGDVEVNDETA